jgi:hypothetical protein
MDVPKSESSTSDSETKMLEGEIRALVRGHRPAKAAEAAAETCDDVLAVGATSIADIEKLMEELQTACDYLQSEGERLRQVNARYAHLAQTASASVKVIAESLGKWRNLETLSQAALATPKAPSLSPVHDDEIQHESNDQ